MNWNFKYIDMNTCSYTYKHFFIVRQKHCTTLTVDKVLAGTFHSVSQAQSHVEKASHCKTASEFKAFFGW